MTAIKPLEIEAFAEFYQQAGVNQGHAPFAWQRRLNQRVCQGNWPEFIKLPTASGKTCCLDIAVYALAYQASQAAATGTQIRAPRRIFFVVDRRIIVNEVYERASELAQDLAQQQDTKTTIGLVAHWLRWLASGGETREDCIPLDCYELRGGIYRDDAWVRSILQPTILTSTVDQVGSRMLFSGYGVSDRNAPIHAALTTQDSLIILDEAHCSKPFSQTAEQIKNYQQAPWCKTPLNQPLQFVQMTATPESTEPERCFVLNESEDYQSDAPLVKRHQCAKPVALSSSSAKSGKAFSKSMARDLVAEAVKLAEGDKPAKRIAIIANRVAIAREAYALLKKHKSYGDQTDLVIGRMRSIDREVQTQKLKTHYKSGTRSEADSKPRFLVATQCIEVGADYDFDGMVTQCASMDALRQRFGRLNRLGNSEYARGVIVMAEVEANIKKETDIDPIYGMALPKTWQWLNDVKGDQDAIDFGITAMESLMSDAPKDINVEAGSAPVLMPAHMDLLCQTGPRPYLQPEVAPYLHGKDKGIQEVRVCWRADLIKGANDSDKDAANKAAVLALPPTSAECLAVPLKQFKAWLSGNDKDAIDDTGDVLSQSQEEVEFKAATEQARIAYLYQPGQSADVRELSGAGKQTKEIKPNSTLILPAYQGGWEALGHIPDAPPDPAVEAIKESHQEKHGFDVAKHIDKGSDSFRLSRNRIVIRLHETLARSSDEKDEIKAALATLKPYKESKTLAIVDRELILKCLEKLDNDFQQFHERNLRETSPHENSDSYIVIDAEPLPKSKARKSMPLANFGDEVDSLSQMTEKTLDAHLKDVQHVADASAAHLKLPDKEQELIRLAAARHDLGKADPRFQAKLLNTSLDLAYMQPKLWAKSPSYFNESDTHELPEGFRHEMLSVLISDEIDRQDEHESDRLLQHLIASHHGHARPFAPVWKDDNPPSISLQDIMPEIQVTAETRLGRKAHKLGNGIAENFWQLTRHYGCGASPGWRRSCGLVTGRRAPIPALAGMNSFN